LHDQRHCEAKRLRRFEIDDQLEFSGLDDRQVRWFGALKNSTGIDPGLTICVRKVGSVAHQTAHLYLLSNWKDYGYCVTRYQCHESSGCAQEKRVCADHECAGSLFDEGRNRCFQVVFGAGAQKKDLLSDGAGCLLHVMQLDLRLRIVWVYEHADQ
jgi:hypothetical protein